MFFMAIGLLMAMNVFAQQDTTQVKPKKERTVRLYGEVYDSFTKAKLKAHVTLMKQDSTVIDTMTCWTWGTSSYYQFSVPAKPQKIIIKGTCANYEDTYLDYELKYLARNRSFELPRLLMKKKMQDDDIWREDSLGGVVVKGTKVKIAYRGDTIVYNASAFNMPEGSMLDGLIRQMPGAELKQNGDIYINGQKVDYLTLNGKDFFKGKNQVMLDNLPYYTVQNIKVFHKSTKQSELARRDIEKKDYVMDVNLKREYNRGYMGNVEAGIGTEDRYMARLFGLYYTDHSRYTVYGNLNNVNENRKPGGEGEWRPSNMPQGLRTTKQAGMDFQTEDADKRFEEEGSVSVEWNDASNASRTTSETFATGGSIFRGAWSESRQKDFRFHVSNDFTLHKPFTLYSQVGFDYADGKRTTASQDSTYRDFITNRTQNEGLNKYRSLSGNASLSYYQKLPWGDMIDAAVDGSFSRTDPSDGFSRQNTYYATSGTNDLRDRYADTHSNSYEWQARTTYHFALPDRWSIRTGFTYTQAWQSNHNSNYRLDWLGPMRPNELGWLPSTRDSLLAVIDTDNSNDNQLLTRTYQGGITIDKQNDNYILGINLPYEHAAERLHYEDGTLDTIARRTSNAFQPSVYFYQWKEGFKMLSYNFRVGRPELASLMPVDNTTNPLVYRVNNPNLRNRKTHNLRTRFTHNVDSLKRTLSLWANLRIEQDKWGTRTIYDTTTGAYSFMNDNVDGNWGTDFGATYTFPLDKKRHLLFTEDGDVGYDRSVDFNVQYVETMLQQAEQVLSKVNNWTLHNRLQLQYQKDELTATLSGNITWRSSTGDRQNFQRISAFDLDYGATFNYTIPWMKVGVATDLRMFSRRGYYSELMNDNHLVWNAQLTRTLMKGKLTCKLQVFDLLHQLSSTQYNVNAQGRTETWNNCIPRYVMLTMQYKITQKPKM